jgi:hypothetical protein
VKLPLFDTAHNTRRQIRELLCVGLYRDRRRIAHHFLSTRRRPRKMTKVRLPKIAEKAAAKAKYVCYMQRIARKPHLHKINGARNAVEIQTRILALALLSLLRVSLTSTRPGLSYMLCPRQTLGNCNVGSGDTREQPPLAACLLACFAFCDRGSLRWQMGTPTPKNNIAELITASCCVTTSAGTTRRTMGAAQSSSSGRF